MKILVLSDLHNEVNVFNPPQVTADVVVLAGDIDIKGRGVMWASEAFPNSQVLYVLGNHEYYGGHLTNTLGKMRVEARTTPNVRVLERDSVVIDGVRFLGMTAWTDYTATGNLPIAQADAKDTMLDFRKIRAEGYRRVKPLDFMTLNSHSKAWLRQQLEIAFSGKTVVITHHSPSLIPLSQHPEAGTHLDAAYGNNWDDMMGSDIDLWIHGHTHCSFDGLINGTRNVSNPRGYPGEQTGFDPERMIHLSAAPP